MISRRPKRRASSENAPGPSRIIAATIITTKKIDSRVSNRFEVGTGIHANAALMIPSPIITLAMGVRNPSRRAAPLAIATDPAIHAARAARLPSTR